MAREFNIFGPVDPRFHYHVDRKAVKAAMRQKIDKGRYFTLNAARQTGKTTLFREVITEIEREGEHFGLLLDFETLRGYNRAEFYYWLHQKTVESWQIAHPSDEETLAWLEGYEVQEQNAFGLLLRSLGERLGKLGVLIIDEFDAIGAELAEPMLAVFREMYLHRTHAGYYPLQSIILVGVRNIPALLGGSQSPFNIADQYELPYFTSVETEDLLRQHTVETGQPYAAELFQAVYQESEGQPFLVNRLGQLLTETIVPERTAMIGRSHLRQAVDRLLQEDNAHFASIVSKAMPHRSVLLPILFYDEKRTKFRDPVTKELIMYGVLRVVEDGFGNQIARIANPIYRKVLILAFTPPSGDVPLNGSFRHRYVVEGVLDFEGLLAAFQKMMTEHGITLLRSKKTDRPLEIGGQYLLLSYLTAALDSIGGHVTLESLNSAGEMDLLVFYRGSRFIIESKIWYTAKRFAAGQQQLAAYLDAAHQDKGFMILFSEQPVDEATVPSQTTVNGKQILTYRVAIGD